MITLNIKSQKNIEQLMSAQELKDKFLFGVQLAKDGKEMPDETFDFYIQYAKAQIERYLTVKLDLQIITENKDFHYSDWIHWSLVKTTYFIVCPISLQGFVGTTKQVDYPKEWLSVRKDSDDELFSRMLHVLPNSYTTYNQSAALYTGFFPNAGMLGAGMHTPNYWNISYITGFKKVPVDIITAIGMLASINILAVGNETLASAMGALGGSSKSISLDGLSQSTSLYINGQTGIFGARIKQYTEALNGVSGQDGLLKRLQDYFGAFVWGVC